MKVLRGFTLSELVVTLAVVGIIAALTVPGLVQHYQRDTQVTMLKKVYMNLQDNLSFMQTENIGLRFDKSLLGEESPDVEKFFDDYYNVTLKCGRNPSSCFAPQYKNIRKSVLNTDFSDDNTYCVQFKDSSSMCIIPQSALPATVFVDVNGPDKPNVVGRDMFSFHIYDDFSVDVVPPDVVAGGTATAARENLFNNDCLGSYYGTGCFGKILNDDWKMNY